MGIFTFFQDADNYDDRKIGRDMVNGVVVSTAYTSDEGYETAILDKEDVHPVERYETKEDAIVGHKRWKLKAKTIDKVMKLGWQGIVDAEEVEIIRGYED